MQLLCCVALLFLCSLPFLSSVFPLQCSSTQYPWPVTDSKMCCEMCLPGQRLVRRNQCVKECVSCPANQYRDTHNEELTCIICRSCKKAHMEYKSPCNSTKNAECRCKTGYSCKDKDCNLCVLIPVITKPTLPPSTTICDTEVVSTSVSIVTVMRQCNNETQWTASKTEAVTTFKPKQPIAETAWFLVIITLLCIGIALVLVTKIKPLLRWIRSKDSFFFTDKPEQSYSEDDSECTPVQEVCGECDQPIDVCIKC